jgi:diguanylate cyclase (GGDEF)-like protein
VNGGSDGATPRRSAASIEAMARLEDLAADQTASDLDQQAADADGTASGADREGSERDEDDAARDQKSADRDQEAADQSRAQHGDGAADATYEATKEARAGTRLDRLGTHAGRSETESTRLSTARQRDRNASRRDDSARRREARSVELEAEIEASDDPIPVQFARLRERAKRDRARAALDRNRAAVSRAEAAAARTRLQSALHSAHLDDLTGAFHREMGWHALQLEIDRSRRGDGQFVLAFLDVDGLKAINDRSGHAAGDLVLHTLVATLRASLRSFDPIMRFGGDEFVGGIGGADIGEVERRLFAARRSLYADTGATFSFGLAALAWGETLEQLMVRADAVLLEAKRSSAA